MAETSSRKPTRMRNVREPRRPRPVAHCGGREVDLGVALSGKVRVSGVGWGSEECQMMIICDLPVAGASAAHNFFHLFLRGTGRSLRVAAFLSSLRLLSLSSSCFWQYICSCRVSSLVGRIIQS